MSVQDPEQLSPSSQDAIVAYLTRRFRESTHPGSEEFPVTPNITLPVELVADADLIVDRLAKAVSNPKIVKFRAADLLRALKANENGNDEDREGDLLQRFPPGEPAVIDEPAIVIDNDGTIILWYLPGAIRRSRQDHLMQTMGVLSPAFQKSIEGRNTSWRTDRALFNACPDMIRGCLNMSPAWFQLGQSGANKMPEPSATLRSSSPPCPGIVWLKGISETNALLSAAMAVMHPEAYRVGKETMGCVMQHAERTGDDAMSVAASHWASVFNAVSVMMNRQSPYHRDPNSPGKAFDMLTTIGDYTDAWISIPTLSMRFLYSPGAIIAFSGYLLRHGVNSVHGNRACLAYYMRPQMIRWAGRDVPGFTPYELLDSIGQGPKSIRVYLVNSTESD